MRSFNEYLKEVAHQESLSTRLFNLGVDFPAFSSLHREGSTAIKYLWLPISSSIFNRIGIEQHRATVFHVADSWEGINTLNKLQGKKASISAFFYMDSDYFEEGIAGDGGVVVELDANILAASYKDVMSVPDNSGRRWIQLYYFRGQYSRPNNIDTYEHDISNISSALEILIGNLVQKYHPQPEKYTNKAMGGFRLDGWISLGEEREQVDMYNLIKDYIDGVEQIMKANVKDLTAMIRDYLNVRRSNSTSEFWDEQIVNDIKIKKIHSLNYNITYQSEFLSGLKKNFVVKEWDSATGLEKYIYDIAQKEIKK